MPKVYRNTKYDPQGDDRRKTRYMPPELQESFKKFAFFHWKVRLNIELTPLQLEFCDWLQNGWGDPSVERLCLAYRGFGKTSMLKLYQAWWLERYPTEQVVFIGNTDANVKDMGSGILDLIANVPEFQGLRADAEGTKSLSQTAFNVRGKLLAAPRSWRGETFASRGLTGLRGGLLILDDWETAAEGGSAATLKVQIKTATELWNVQSDYKPHWAKIATGTYHHESGFWTEFQGGDFNVRARVYPACYPDLLNDNDTYLEKVSPMVMNQLRIKPTLAGEPCDRLGNRALEKKTGGKLSKNFRYQFMLDNTTGDDVAYPLRCHDLIVTSLDPTNLPKNLVWGTIKPSKLTYLRCPGRGDDAFFGPREGYDIEYAPPEAKVMYVDTAGGGADEMVWVFMAALKGRIFLIDFHAYRSNQRESRFQLTAKAAKKYGVGRMALEQNNNNSALDLMVSVCRELQVDCHCEGVHSFHRKEKRVLPILDELMAQHRLVVHEDVVRKDQRLAQGDLNRQLFHQIAYAREAPSLGLRFDDRIDALAGGCKMLREHVRYSEVPEMVDLTNINERMHKRMVDDMIRKHNAPSRPHTGNRYLRGSGRRSSMQRLFRR